MIGPRQVFLSFCRLLPLLVVVLISSATRGAPSGARGRVLIVAADAPTALLDEGLVRVRGELSAMGLSTDIRREPQPGGPRKTPVLRSFEGALVFERFGDWLRIQAWSPSSAVPVTQWIDASDPAVDAEVVAVRAVEALRAVLLPYLRAQREEQPDPPIDVPLLRPSPTSDQPLPDDTRPVEPSPQTPERPAGSFWVGPAIGVDVGTSAFHYGGQVGFAYGGTWLMFGGHFAASRASIAAGGGAGEVDVTRLVGGLEGRLRVPLGERWDVLSALGGAVVHHQITGVAAPGYIGQREQHTALALSAELGLAHWFSPEIAGYLSARTSFAMDAPVIRANGRDLATLARPDLAMSGSVLFGLD